MADDSDDEMGDPQDHIESNQWRTILNIHNEYEEARNASAGGWEQWPEGTGGSLGYDTWQEEETTEAQFTFTRARDRPYDPQGEPLSLCRFLQSLGNPQTVQGIIHLLKTQPNLLALC